MKQMIYLDNAATTRTRPEVVEAMLPYFSEYYGNPSSIYEFSTPCRKAMSDCRAVLAQSLGVKANEIYFTAGGTEADNWALTAAAEACAAKGKHIITSKIEHHAVLHTCQYLEKRGFEVTYLNVDEAGIVRLEELKKAIRPDTILISIMYANNEIGTLQPIEEIGAIAREHGILFHTDAVQAYGHVPISADACGIDMLSASAHKFGGPKGVGFLYIRSGLKLGAFMHGGAQERRRRGGTENVPGGAAGASGHGRAAAEGTAAAGLPDRPGAERGALYPAQRAPYPAAGQQRQFCLSVYRGRIPADYAGYGRHLRIQRFRLYFRLAGSVPRASGHRTAP